MRVNTEVHASKSCHNRLRSLLLCLCDVFRVPINSLNSTGMYSERRERTGPYRYAQWTKSKNWALQACTVNEGKELSELGTELWHSTSVSRVAIFLPRKIWPSFTLCSSSLCRFWPVSGSSRRYRYSAKYHKDQFLQLSRNAHTELTSRRKRFLVWKAMAWKSAPFAGCITCRQSVIIWDLF